MDTMESSNHVWIGRWLAGLVGLCTAASCASYETATDPCRPREIIPTLQIPDQGSIISNCTIDKDGVVTVRYTQHNTGGWWAGCIFAANQDLTDFDAQTGRGEGVIAVTFCVEGFVPSTLNLRYGSPDFSKYGRTKWMPLISAKEEFKGNGCRVVYLSASDACYAEESCGLNSGCVPDPAPEIGRSCDTFERSQFTIMNEWCFVPPPNPPKETVITIQRMTYYPASCTCDDTSACASPKVCRRDGWPTYTRCNADRETECPGICAP